MTVYRNNHHESFQKHAEYMKSFRKTHAAVALVNGLEHGESPILARTEPLQLKDIIIEAGGTGFLDNAMNWSVYIPMPTVARYKLSRN